MRATERVLQYIEYKGVSKYKFYKETGLSNGFLDKNRNIGSDKCEIISSHYKDLSLNWLITGEGDMLKTQPYQESSTTTIIQEDGAAYNGTIPKGAIPFYNLPVSAGQSVLSIEGAIKPDGYIKDIPGVKNTEAFLPVHGYSMYPEIKEGAIMGVKKSNNWDTLNTQHKYLIITHEDRMVKYIEHDEINTDILWCLSPNYKRFKIFKSEIIDIHRVTFVMNSE